MKLELKRRTQSTGITKNLLLREISRETSADTPCDNTIECIKGDTVTKKKKAVVGVGYHNGIGVEEGEHKRELIQRLMTIPKMLEYNLKLLINFYRDDVVAQLEEAGSLELLKEIRIWSELSTDSEFIINEKIKISYKILIKKSEDCASGLYPINREQCPKILT
ncbi:hypothetical protein C2G38_2247228 [Gigaspora rosea]|uniref:Uncharacterized protein n=1 Tax=Gigaspora rosea TaxID=44941 RepID=A0A397VA07_9GLOM|nr:hypothetical protein C2G38_2247228 [Gigaspora rosea]